ncbi:MAG: hypothetical protein ACRC8P_00315 [Spiroplasma sp.]
MENTQILLLNQAYPPIIINAKIPRDTFLDYVPKDNFKKGIIRHVKDIKNKYIKGDVPFAIMFLPSDNILIELITNFGDVFGQDKTVKSNGENLNFLEYCFENKIVPVSSGNIISVLTMLERYFIMYNKQ